MKRNARHPGPHTSTPGAVPAKALASLISAALLSMVMMTTAAAGVTVPAPLGPASYASVVLTGSPGAPAVDNQTGTLYVPVQCAKSFCPTSAPGRVVDVISTTNCNSQDRSGCRVLATAPAAGPVAAAVDQATDTLYMANAGGTLTVVDGALCNAQVTSGCNKDLATIKLGPLTNAAYNAVVDPLTSTLYVPGARGVFVVDLANCNAQSTSGCSQQPELVSDPDGPVAADVDLATNTVYVANIGAGSNAGNGDTVSVIKGATCDGGDHSGCGLKQETVKVGSGPNWVAVDQADGAVYVANFNDGTVSVIDGAQCDATVSSGCARPVPAVFTGEQPSFVAVDAAAHTVFTLNSHEDTFSEIGTASCTGGTASRCPATVPRETALPDVDPGFMVNPNTAAFTWGNDTAYVVNVGGPNVLDIVGLSLCGAAASAGCRAEAPRVPEPGSWSTYDTATGTLYASNEDNPQVDVINAATCDPAHLAGCAPVAKIPMKDTAVALGAVDDATHTLFVADPTTGKVSIINTATCNAQRTSGCPGAHPTIDIGPTAGSPVVNSGTGTLYVPYGKTLDHIAVVDITACNAETTSGCGRRHGEVTVGQQTNELGLSETTDTLYAVADNTEASLPVTYGNGFSGTAGHLVYVVNGSTCNGTDIDGCGHVAATVNVGTFPYGIAVDDATRTVYVADNHNGDQLGDLTMIDEATCNGFDTRGCHQAFPTVYVGRSPRLIALDPEAGLLYVTDRSSAAVSVLHTAGCNALVTSGCPAYAPEVAVGSKPVGISVDPVTGTAYVMNTVSGTMSVINES